MATLNNNIIYNIMYTVLSIIQFYLFQVVMSPPETLVRRWRKLKKRCSFSASDRLVRSKSFTEQDVLKAEPQDPQDDKYLTVGARDANKFQGIREKINQWNHDLKKRRSSENLAGTLPRHETTRDEEMFVVVAPQQGYQGPQQGYVRSALVVSATTKERRVMLPSPRNSTPIKPSPPGRGDRKDTSLWSSPSPSPPASDHSSDFSQENQRNESYSSTHLYQDQDSGYDGFCPEKSIYSTGSSETSSLLSSEGPEHSGQYPEIYAKPRVRPRPSPIYEKHGDYRAGQRESLGHYGAVSTTPRAKIAQATVINLVKTRSASPDVPPPLPPRPTFQDAPHSLPPLPNPKPRNRQILHGAVSLPRKRADFQDRARRRGSYHEQEPASLVKPPDISPPTVDKVKTSNNAFRYVHEVLSRNGFFV